MSSEKPPNKIAPTKWQQVDPANVEGSDKMHRFFSRREARNRKTTQLLVDMDIEKTQQNKHQ